MFTCCSVNDQKWTDLNRVDFAELEFLYKFKCVCTPIAFLLDYTDTDTDTNEPPTRELAHCQYITSKRWRKIKNFNQRRKTEKKEYHKD